MYWSHFQKDLPVDTDANVEWVRRLQNEPLRCDYSDIPEAPESSTVGDFLGWLLATLSREGLEEVLVLNLTNPTIGVPVVKVVVPGLEFSADKAHFTPGPRMQRFLAQL
jgi:ribosomal protein S12 methylthiotransferase accessory factor